MTDRFDVVWRQDGLPAEEALARLGDGMVVVTNVALRPTARMRIQNPDLLPVEGADVWFHAPGALHATTVAIGILSVGESGGDIVTLNRLAELLLSIPYSTLLSIADSEKDAPSL